jgi:hypothetical protein
MRLLEGLRLRVKNFDFARCGITVRDSKGGRVETQLGNPSAGRRV